MKTIRRKRFDDWFNFLNSVFRAIPFRPTFLRDRGAVQEASEIVPSAHEERIGRFEWADCNGLVIVTSPRHAPLSYRRAAVRAAPAGV
ncbi:hypothetical protein EVAR_87768_1 [Eumeta japonica]|uniref:Uncharacterized protein n=1 Tax=Eumeta variegata TaxID=151549 RepID=A0A4C1X3A3_EUMVA|nr:hypothetical protein EVAR_87768_1 [Eumeta japonica]